MCTVPQRQEYWQPDTGFEKRLAYRIFSTGLPLKRLVEIFSFYGVKIKILSDEVKNMCYITISTKTRKDVQMNLDAKIVKPKLGVLELSRQLGRVTQACKVFGYSRDSFYR